MENAGAPAGTGAEGSADAGAAPAAEGAGAGQVQDGAAPVVPQTPAQKFKFKFQVDGKEVEEEYSETDLKNHLQKSKGADKRFQEANELKQRSERLYELMKNPKELKKLLAHPKLYGEKSRQVLEEILWEEVQREQMDPKEREHLETKERLRTMEEQEKARQETARQAEFKTLQAKYATQIDTDIKLALKESGMPVSTYNFKRVAHYMLQSAKEGKPISPKDALTLVQEDWNNDLRTMFEETNEDQIISLLKSDKAWENIRKADLKRVAKKTPAAPAPATTLQGRDSSGQFVPKPDSNDLLKRTSIFDY